MMQKMLEDPRLYHAKPSTDKPALGRELKSDWVEMFDWPLYVEVSVEYQTLDQVAQWRDRMAREVLVSVGFRLEHKTAIWAEQGFRPHPMERPARTDTPEDAKWNLVIDGFKSLKCDAKQGKQTALLALSREAEALYQVYVPRVTLTEWRSDSRVYGAAVTWIMEGTFSHLYRGADNEHAQISYQEVNHGDD